MSDPQLASGETQPTLVESILASGARELGITLSASQLAQFDRFQGELLDWNERMNLTAITEPGAVQTRHFLDSLTVLAAISGATDPGEVRHRIVDVGAGAGLPGIPLAIVLPRSHIVLVEATRKKCGFLEHAVATIELANVDVVCGRAEDVAHRPAFRETFDDAVARALAPLPALVELSVPFLRVGGRLIAMKKIGIDEEIEGARKAVNLVGGRFRSPVLVNVPVLNEKRQLVVIEKLKPTPPDYPRRDGLPAKSPLGSSPARPAGLTRPAPARR
jgi:16S rRNA (guanine527-N7)-methyltransferase